MDIRAWHEQRVQAEEMYESQGHAAEFAWKQIEIDVGATGWSAGTTYAEAFVRQRPERLSRIAIPELVHRAGEETETEYIKRLRSQGALARLDSHFESASTYDGRSGGADPDCDAPGDPGDGDMSNGNGMNVLILGGNGLLGPYVVEALGEEYTLRLTDINDLVDSPHEYRKVDVSDIDQVMAAAEGMDAIVNLSVLRHVRGLAFDVNARGCYNMMAAAVRHGIRRVINTGPLFIYDRNASLFDHELGPDLPPHSGTELYEFTKGLGQEICKVFTENHDVYLMTFIYGSFRDPEDPSEFGKGGVPFMQTYPDAAEAFPLALSVDLDRLPSRCELFNILSDVPGQKFLNEKAKRILGWRPRDKFEKHWTKVR